MLPIKVEDLYRQIVETAYEGIWILDAGMRTRFVNQRLAEMLGYPPQEMSGTLLSEYFLSEDKAAAEGFERWMSGVSEDFEAAYRRRDNSALRAHVSANPLYDEAGKQSGVLLLLSDLTGRKIAEDAFRNSENRLRLMTDSLPALISYVDREHRYRFVNENYTNWFGRQPEEILGRHMSEVLGEAAYRALKPEMERALAGEKLSFERFVPYKEGGSRYVQINYIPDFDEAKNAQGLFVMVLDMTEKKQILENLKNSEERYRAFVSRSSEGIWRMELDQPVPINLPPHEQIERFYRYASLAECNNAMARMYGYDLAEEIVGARLSDLIPPTDEGNVEYLKAFILSGYRLEEAESYEIDREGKPKFFLNNLVGFIENGSLVRAWGTQRDITRRKEIEKATAHLAAIVASSEDAIISKDLDSVITSWNKAAEKIFGYTAREAIGQSITIIIPPAFLDEEAMIISRIKNGDVIESYETVRRRKDGAEIDVSVTISPIWDEAGKIIGVSKIARDISERKAARDISERYRLLLIRARDIILFIRADGRISEANQAAVEAYGYDYDALLKLRIHELRAPETQALVDEQYKEANETGIQFETIHQRRDGSRFPVEVSAIGADVGRERYIISLIRDISDRKRTQEALEENRMMLSLAMRSSGMGVWEHDIATGTVNWSEELEAIFGLEKGGFGGTEAAYYQLIHEDDQQQAWAEVQDAVAGHRDYAIEFRFHHADGSLRWMEGRGRAVYSEKGEPVRLYGIGIDITERKHAQQSLVESARRQAALYRLADQLHRARSLDDVYGATLQAIVDALECDRASILLFDEGGVMRFVSWRGLSEAYRRATDGHSPWRQDEKNPTPIYINDLEAAEIEEPLKTVIKNEGIGALAFIPLVFDGRLIGKFMAYFNAPHRFSDKEIELGLTIARQLVFGIARQRAENELLESEERLRKSEAEFRRLANALPQIVWVAAADGSILYLNEQWTEFSGLDTEATAKRENFQEVFHPDDRDAVLRAWKKSFREGTPFEIEGRMKKRATGEYHWFLMRAVATKDAAGKILKWFGTSTDITVNKKTEDALRESEARFRNMADNAPVMIWVTDADGTTTYLSKSWYEFTGQTGETEPGFGWLGAVHPDDRKLVEESFLTSNAKHEPFKIEYRISRQDGSYSWAIDSAQPRFSENGAFLGFIGSVIDISERKAAEEKIRESESTLRAYYNSSPLMMGIVELLENENDLLHIYDNPATCAFFGVEQEASSNRRSSELGSSQVVTDLWTKHYRESRELNRPVSFEYEQSIGAAPRWLSVTVSYIGIVGDRPRFAYVAEETTERKRSEEQMRYQLDLTQTITDNTRMCLLMMDAEGRGTFANYAAERITGFKPEELIGQILHDKIHHMHPDGTPFPIELCPLDNALPLQEAVVAYEDVFVHKDGYFYPVRCNGRPIFKDGKPAGTVIEVQDITEERRAQEALLRAERRAADEYQKLLERIVPLGQTLGTARDLPTIYRAVHEFILSSMKCSAFFVSSYDAVNQCRLAEYVWGEGMEIDVSGLPPVPLSPDGGANSQAIFQKKTIITNNYWEAQKNRPHVVVLDDGVHPMSSLVVPMLIKNEVVGTLEVQAHENEAFSREQAVALEMVANLASVAIENVRLLEVEASARQAAEAANRAKDEFLSVLSHELRTPLNSMLGWVRMLKSGMLDEEKTDKAIEVIERNTLLQNNLIEDLLDVSRIISGKMRIERKPIDLVRVFSDAVDILRPVAEQKNLSFEFRTREDSLMIDGDATRLQQIISNLVQNAVKFTPEGGSISVSLARADDKARLVVKDDGIGINNEILPFIFERFRQADSSTKRVYSGLGLGLTIVRNLTELHGGTITAESPGEGGGASFTIDLPLAEDFLRKTSAARKNALTVERQTVLRGARILLVDDDLESLIPLQLFLEKEMAEIVLATSAQEALEKLAAQNFHVLITDIGMPLADGYDLIAKVRQLQTEQNAFITAIALTAYASTEDRRRALSAGFQHHFAKPINYDELLRALREIYEVTNKN